MCGTEPREGDPRVRSLRGAGPRGSNDTGRVLLVLAALAVLIGSFVLMQGQSVEVASHGASASTADQAAHRIAD